MSPMWSFMDYERESVAHISMSRLPSLPPWGIINHVHPDTKMGEDQDLLDDVNVSVHKKAALHGKNLWDYLKEQRHLRKAGNSSKARSYKRWCSVISIIW